MMNLIHNGTDSLNPTNNFSPMNYNYNPDDMNPNERHSVSSVSSVEVATSTKSGKSIPIELTAYGTTPSGKPRLFVCQVCTRAFARLEHLRRHERSHTKEKPFSCGVCQRKFSRRDLLLRHAQKLHAGCSEAITRLRRRSSRKGSVSSTPTSTPGRSDSLDAGITSSSHTPGVDEKSTTPTFSYNSFNDHFGSSSELYGNANKMSRRASFSAASGANYANGNGTPHVKEENYPGDHVEFSTPQLLPINDAESWLNNLGPIPGLDFLGNNPHNGGNVIPSNVMLSPRSNGHGDPIVAPTKPTNPTTSVQHEETGADDMDLDPNGYSFYDMPQTSDTLLQETTHRGGVGKLSKSNYYHTLSPIKQEESASPFSSDETESNKNVNPRRTKNSVARNLDDFEELAELNIPKNFNLPNGYSFYGDSIPVSDNSTNATISPQQLENNHSSPDMTTSQFNHSNQKTQQQQQQPQAQAQQPQQDYYQKQDARNNTTTRNAQMYKNGNFSRNKLFTNNMRYMINKTLGKYPISGIMAPSIPSNEKLEYYLNKFVELFLSHFPFIHISKLNEYEVMHMTSNEDINNESARVCLPLLIATMGALLANSKNDAENLYEASRRSIHIFLETRKNSPVLSESNNQNPLWLIQSLALSVLYGLFSDNENNVYIVIRQLSALNSLVKSSIQSNTKNLFSIIEDGTGGVSAARRSSLFSYDLNDEIKFKASLNNQSQKRIVLFIYRLTNFLLMLYNNPLTLSINDLVNIELLTKNEESLWNFKNFQQYQEFKRINPLSQQFDLLNDEDVKVTVKDMLIELTKPDNVNKPVPELLTHISKFGLVTLVHGIYEVKKLQHINKIDIFTILDKVTNMSNNEPINELLAGTMEDEIQKLDFTLVASYSKVSSLISFNALKEQVWLRNFDEFNRNFSIALNDVNELTDYEYLKIVDCVFELLQSMLFVKDPALDLREIQTNKYSKAELDVIFANLRVEEDNNSQKISIHSQMIFHGFLVLILFSIFMTKRNHQKLRSLSNHDLFNEFQINSSPGVKEEKPRRSVGLSDYDEQLNFKYELLLRLLSKVEEFLKRRYQYLNLEVDFAKLNLFNNDNKSLLSNSYNLEKTIYIIRIGELILEYIYDSNIKVFIFKRLSETLTHLRVFMIENEQNILV